MFLDRIQTLPVDGLNLPNALKDLERLATNLFWTWQTDIQQIFADIDPIAWKDKKGPVEIIAKATNLELLAKDDKFVARVKAAAAKLDAYLAAEPKAWYSTREDRGHLAKNPVAYFCAEYAFYESFNQYAGGLGILAGDHCKEASDLGFPFVAVGLFYHRGFFHQMVDWDGRQEHLYPCKDPHFCSAVRVAKPGTKDHLKVQVEFAGRTVTAGVWLYACGRMPVVLLSTDLPENAIEDRAITSQLYCNGRSMRLHQETILGVGGVRALDALGIEPSVWHMNEGHSAFLLLERLRKSVLAGHSFADSKKAIKKNSIITIHTPVPEGNERFDAKLAKTLIEPITAGSGISTKQLLTLAQGADGDPAVFDMTAFALRLSTNANGVSLLHGRTADSTWRNIAKMRVIGVTNGVHMPTWIGESVRNLYAESGIDLSIATRVEVNEKEDRPNWDGAEKIDSGKLWAAHNQQKVEMIEFLRERLRTQHERHGEGPEDLREIAEYLDPEAMIIGFGRRFAPYKRANLLFSDEARVNKLLNRKGQKIQLVFTGKSHPIDRKGQELVQKVYHITQEPQFKGKVFHIEDYDMEVGRYIVRGSDVWLNNPRRPLEASGTSGMKAAANAIPNVSILDGWWDEGYDKKNRNGFAIGGRKVPDTLEEQDAQDALALYKVLEKEVVPLFFKRGEDGLPHEWIEVMKRALGSSIYSFSTARMIRDYLDLMYEPAALN